MIPVFSIDKSQIIRNEPGFRILTRVIEVRKPRSITRPLYSILRLSTSGASLPNSRNHRFLSRNVTLLTERWAYWRKPSITHISWLYAQSQDTVLLNFSLHRIATTENGRFLTSFLSTNTICFNVLFQRCSESASYSFVIFYLTWDKMNNSPLFLRTWFYCFRLMSMLIRQCSSFHFFTHLSLSSRVYDFSTMVSLACSLDGNCNTIHCSSLPL